MDLNALYVLQALDSLQLSDAHVEEDRDGALSGPRLEDDTVVPDKLRRRQASPKRRKIEHESSLLFEVLTCFHTEVSMASLTCSWAPGVQDLLLTWAGSLDRRGGVHVTVTDYMQLP